ncbi:hypothetical protein [Salicibibacter cibarius]|uniref:hypothetical protein n=1 Tax=Salicibibacter cibarius TaxID=2743000 RepID=UPI001904E2EC|nr:hypothetical protein [Salicibibacter cibarius]
MTTETVRDWIEKGLLPAHRIGKRGRYKVPREYFEYVKRKREEGFDITEDIMKDVLGDDYSSDWEIDMDEGARG